MDVITGPRYCDPILFTIVKMSALVVVVLIQRWRSLCELWRS
jgi:hypothetical protein